MSKISLNNINIWCKVVALKIIGFCIAKILAATWATISNAALVSCEVIINLPKAHIFHRIKKCDILYRVT